MLEGRVPAFQPGLKLDMLSSSAIAAADVAEAASAFCRLLVWRTVGASGWLRDSFAAFGIMKFFCGPPAGTWHREKLQPRLECEGTAL